MTYFDFYNTKNEIKLDTESKIFHIPENLERPIDIFHLYESELNIPSDFGKNWNAFFDNIRLFEFINEKNVLIIHQDIPFYQNKEIERAYIEILFDAVRHWWEFPEHKLYVYFPESCRSELDQIIETR